VGYINPTESLQTHIPHVSFLGRMSGKLRGRLRPTYTWTDLYTIPRDERRLQRLRGWEIGTLAHTLGGITSGNR